MTGWIGDIEDATTSNTTFRTVLFTGDHLQLTVMSIPAGSEIGLEAHGHLDQFIRVEEGEGRLDMGPAEDQIDEHHALSDDWAAIIPAGTWHNVVNTGAGDLKLYSIYTPPEHPDGTVHQTKAEADAAEHDHDH
ncbi:cupin domain-containing protein [Actinomarinicola tropica]|uniref:Cupin domain-containing protein n=1 Tax=Actinomarinicola tropica TaxID=2789776 RepID=A0A5Q2RHV7_9ACTN|nr:cupin domain-containing protein [Actinomarinicola tropica]QGG95393.1 cupin domain-containing protein [Actinomarinicola tropica]